MTRKAEPPVKKNAFVHKLYQMLQDPRLSNLIWWLEDNPDHNTFLLHPDKEFAAALTGYFKHGNVALFVRQLHMYGFHKVLEPLAPLSAAVGSVADDGSAGTAPGVHSERAPVWEFRHSLGRFKKDDEQSLIYIKRRLLSHSSRGAYDPPAPAPASYYMPQYYDPNMYYAKPGAPGAAGAPPTPYPQPPPGYPPYPQLAYMPPPMMAPPPAPSGAMPAPMPTPAVPGVPPPPLAHTHQPPPAVSTPTAIPGQQIPRPPQTAGSAQSAQSATGAGSAPQSGAPSRAPYQSPAPPPHPYPPPPHYPLVAQAPPAPLALGVPPVPTPAPVAQAPAPVAQAPAPAPAPPPVPQAPIHSTPSPAPINHQQPHFRKIWHLNPLLAAASRPRNPSLLYDPLAPAPPPPPSAPHSSGAHSSAGAHAHMAPPPTHGHNQLLLVSEQPLLAEGLVSSGTSGASGAISAHASAHNSAAASRSSSYHHHQRPSAGSIGSIGSMGSFGTPSAPPSAPPSVPLSNTLSILGPTLAPLLAPPLRLALKLPPPLMLRLSLFKFHEQHQQWEQQRPQSPPGAPSGARASAQKLSVLAMIRPLLVELHLRHQLAQGLLDLAMALLHSNLLFSNKLSVLLWLLARVPLLGMAPFDDVATALPPMPMALRLPLPSVGGALALAALDKRATAGAAPAAPAATAPASSHHPPQHGRSLAVPVTLLLEEDDSALATLAKRARIE